MTQKRFLAAFAPSQDPKDRFFSTTPTSLGWALAPLINDIDKGKIDGISYVPKIYDPLRMTDKVKEEFKELVRKEEPDILLISSTYDSHNSAITLARIAKEENPDIIIVYGGPHVDEVCNSKVIELMPQVYPFNEPNSPFDILVEGDGEYVLRQIVLDAKNFGSRKRLFEHLESKNNYKSLYGTARIHFKNEGEIFVLNIQNPIDLNSLPYIPRHMFGNDMDKYGFSCFKDDSGRLLPSTSTMLHRGCKHFCIYCSERGNYNPRSIEHIAGELELLKGSGIEGVFFDDSTLSDQDDFDKMLQVLKSFGLRYGSLNRFDKLQDPKYVEKLAYAGFVYQYCSFEQIDDQVLKNNGKGQRILNIHKGVENLHNNGFELGVSLLFGLRGETEDTIKRTIDYTAEWVNKGLIVAVSMSLYTYHPNTPLTLATDEGKTMHRILRYDCTPPHSGYPWNNFEEGLWYHPPWVTEERVEEIWKYANDRLGNVLVRNMRKDGTRIYE